MYQNNCSNVDATKRVAYFRFHVRAVIEVLSSFQVNHNSIHVPFFIGLLLALAATARTTPTGRFRARF